MEFRILGPLEVIEDGQALDLGGQKQRALLAVLLLHANEVVSVATAWSRRSGPKRPPETARRRCRCTSRSSASCSDATGSRPGLSAICLRIDEDELDLAASDACSRRAGPKRRLRSGAARRSPTSPTSLRAGRDRAAGGAAAGCLEERIEPRSSAGRHARPRRRARGARRRAPAARAPAGTADAGSLSLRAAGRGARAYQRARAALVESSGSSRAATARLDRRS